MRPLLRHRVPTRASALALACVLAGAGPGARAMTAEDLRADAADRAAQRADMHAMKRAWIWDGARRRQARVAEHARLERAARHGDAAAARRLAGFRLKRPHADADGMTAAPPPAPARPAPPEAATATQVLPANVRANDPAGDAATAGQAETAVAVLGAQVVLAWNDGQGFTTGGDTQGYAWSSDGGASFTDGGDIPSPAAYPGWRWTSDPVLTVNARTGEFWYCGLADPDPSTNAIAVARGRFSGGGFGFDSVFVVRLVANATAFLDKQWLAADSARGVLHLTATTFASSNHVDYQRSTDGGRTWSLPVQLSATADNGLVQGSRVATGPAGEVHVVWFAADAVTDEDNLRYRRSLDGGVSFAAPVTPVRYIANGTTGAPGFNRERGIAYPSLAVDRSTGAQRGRVHIAWPESYDFWDDVFPATTGPSRVEAEPNGTAATATPCAVGQVLRGALSTTAGSSDHDYWAIPLAAGQHLQVLADSVRSTTGTSNSAAFTLRLLAPDGVRLLAYGGDLDSAAVASVRWTFTAPVTGTYLLRMAAVSRRTQHYRIRTLLGTREGERGRDHRDVFGCHSDDGLAWSAPVRLSTDAAGFDNWLPEIGVGADGMPYAWWYDHRDDLYGGRTHGYLARSPDGGSSWPADARFTTAPGDFTAAASNIAPNHGDYNGLAASATALHPVWSDGRGASVDTWSARIATTTTVTACARDTTAAPGAEVGLAWTLRNDHPLFANDYTLALTTARGWSAPPLPARTLDAGASAVVALPLTVPDSAAAGPVAVELAVTNAAGVVVARCTATLTVASPALAVAGGAAGLALALPSPHPVTSAAWLEWSQPRAGAMRLTLHDLTGARVRTLAEGVQPAGPGRVHWDGRDHRGTPVRPGSYFARLETADGVRTRRLVVLP